METLVIDRRKWEKNKLKTEFDAKNVYFGEVFSFARSYKKLCTFDFKSKSNII